MKKFGAFLGYLIGDGHISDVKRTIGLTTGDETKPITSPRWWKNCSRCHAGKKRDGGRSGGSAFSSANLADFLKHLGLKTGVCAAQKNVPEAILRSPKSVVAAFLRAYYDCDGYAGSQGVILSTSSTEMSKTVQLLLLNFGILSRRRLNKDGCWHVHTMASPPKLFLNEIGFGLARKQESAGVVRRSGTAGSEEEQCDDEIVAIERAGRRVRHLRRGDAPLRRPGLHQPQQLLALAPS